MATVVALAVVASVLPLRGGHGQHAHAGPGTLTVGYLVGAAPDRGRGNDDERNSHPPSDECFTHPHPLAVIWPPEPSPAELRLIELLDPAPVTDYVGRHRLVEPVEVERYAPPPLLDVRAGRSARPVAA